MNIDEAIKHLKHFTKSQVYQLVHRGEIPCENLGKELLLDKKKLDKLNDNRLFGLEKDQGFITMGEV